MLFKIGNRIKVIDLQDCEYDSQRFENEILGQEGTIVSIDVPTNYEEAPILVKLDNYGEVHYDFYNHMIETL